MTENQEPQQVNDERPEAAKKRGGTTTPEGRRRFAADEIRILITLKKMVITHGIKGLYLD